MEGLGPVCGADGGLRVLGEGLGGGCVPGSVCACVCVCVHTCLFVSMCMVCVFFKGMSSALIRPGRGERSVCYVLGGWCVCPVPGLPARVKG